MWKYLRSLFFLLPPEAAHYLAFAGLGVMQTQGWMRGMVSCVCNYRDDALKIRLFGLDFPNPLGVAAGFDKDADVLPSWPALGFGHVEIGTITPLPQEGNPRPRLYRVPPDRALINRMGFNNLGSQVIHNRMLAFLRKGLWPQMPVGINLGKNRDTPLEKASEDYAALLDAFMDIGDFFVLNVSSPNTPGLRQLQEKSRLDDLLAVLQAKNLSRGKFRLRPLLLKVAPDLEWPQLDDILELCVKHRLAGVVATNTTLSREGLRTPIREEGGLSGAPLRKKSTEFIRYIRRAMGGRLAIVGCGGVFTAEDAYEKIRAGASLVQTYTGFVYQGPLQARQINRGLVRLLQRDGFRNISEAVGKE